MRAVLGILWMIATVSVAAPAPLRFSISDSWAMPMIQLEKGQPTQGILYDLMSSLARQVGRPAQFHVLARSRIDAAMEHGSVDVRCYITQAWMPHPPRDENWSVVLFVQRDVLVSTQAQQVRIASLARQRIGTVLGYSYPALAPLFASEQLKRANARSEEQVLHMLQAGRFQYAVINQWILDHFNQSLPVDRQLHAVALIEEQSLGCYVRNGYSLAGQLILRTLKQMKTSGEIDAIIDRYTKPRTSS